MGEEAREVTWIHDAPEDVDQPIAFAVEPLVEFCPKLVKHSDEWWTAFYAARVATSE